MFCDSVIILQCHCRSTLWIVCSSHKDCAFLKWTVHLHWAFTPFMKGARDIQISLWVSSFKNNTFPPQEWVGWHDLVSLVIHLHCISVGMRTILIVQNCKHAAPINLEPLSVSVSVLLTCYRNSTVVQNMEIIGLQPNFNVHTYMLSWFSGPIVICDKVHQEYMAIVTIQTSLLSKPESISKTDGYKHATLGCMSHAVQHKTNLTTKKNNLTNIKLHYYMQKWF